jgi:cytochrome b561
MVKQGSAESAQSYGPIAQIFHWLIVLLLAVQYTIGLIMPHVGRHTPDEGYVAWHLSIGATILFIIVLRLLWRLFFPVQLPKAVPKWEARLSLFTHWMLYLLVLTMTLLGWAAASARGWDVRIFGLVTLPPLAEKGARWGYRAGDIHGTLVYVLLGFVALHVTGALYHYFVKRDEILQRMLPVVRKRRFESSRGP